MDNDTMKSGPECAGVPTGRGGVEEFDVERRTGGRSEVGVVTKNRSIRRPRRFFESGSGPASSMKLSGCPDVSAEMILVVAAPEPQKGGWWVRVQAEKSDGLIG